VDLKLKAGKENYLSKWETHEVLVPVKFQNKNFPFIKETLRFNALRFSQKATAFFTVEIQWKLCVVNCS
jgi:hypothetical protein